VQVLITVI